MNKYLLKYHAPKSLWLFSVFCACLLNIGLFGFLPILGSQLSEEKQDHDFTRPLNVVKIKKMERPVKKKSMKQKKASKQKIYQARSMHVFRKRSLALDIPFEISPNLPELEMDRTMPEMAAFSIQPINHAYGSGDLDQPVIPIRQIPPIYPIRAKRRGIEGWVRVKIVFDKQGRFENAEILEANPKGYFENSVKRCVSSWQFTPGMLQGESVRIFIEKTIRFELER